MFQDLELAGKQKFCLAKTFEVSAIGFTAHYNKPRTSHQTSGENGAEKIRNFDPYCPWQGQLLDS